MAYSVGVERRVQKQIARLSTRMQDRVEAVLKALTDNPVHRDVESSKVMKASVFE